MEMLISLLVVFCLLLVIYLIFQQKKYLMNMDSLTKHNVQFLDSIEKYIEIFNEQNVNELLEKKDFKNDRLANEKIKAIRDEYRLKLISLNEELTEEHEMLIDFVTLSLSLLIKTPPNLRKKLVQENTGNEIIKKILTSKLSIIEKHYIPISLLEVAISKDTK
jgi:hypothetical protein